MTILLEMLVPAVLLSGLAIACLAAMPNAPPRIRFVIAVLGLSMWLVPWPWISLSLPLGASAGTSAALLDPIHEIASLTDEWTSLVAAVEQPSHRPAALLSFFILGLFLPGLAWFTADYLSLRRSVRSWRRRSRSGEALRSLLPDDLREIRAEIRVVEGTKVAAASGWIRPAIWIGDGLTGAQLRLALVHEACHIRRCDPSWIIVIAVLRRAYWWNPVVAWLARQAETMMESACDEQCARAFGRRHYVEHLASMMLGAQRSASPPLVPNACNAGANVVRLRLLSETKCLRRRDYAAVVATAVAGAILAVSQVAAGPVKPSWSRVTIPATPAGIALTTLLDAFNDGDMELISAYLGAYTPQEVEWHVFDWTTGMELLDVESSDPLRIEYVVKDNGSEARRIGVLEVGGVGAYRVRDSQLRDLPRERR